MVKTKLRVLGDQEKSGAERAATGDLGPPLPKFTTLSHWHPRLEDGVAPVFSQSPTAKFAYVVNEGDGNVSAYQISENGP